MDETLIRKLTAIVESQKKLEEELSKVDISNDPKKYAEMAKKHTSANLGSADLADRRLN